MKAFLCVVLLAAAALAAPEGKRDKRGYLSGGWDSGLELGHGSLSLDHGAVLESYSAPAAEIVSVNKVVHVPQVVEVKKIVSVPKVVSVPQIVKVAKIIEEPSYSGISSGWW